jgi:uncharacterized membrane protein
MGDHIRPNLYVAGGGLTAKMRLYARKSVQPTYGPATCDKFPAWVDWEAMKPSRLEAFSDGVIAVIITIMVLELKVPPSTDLAALRELLPVFLTYVLSFFFLGIYWNNHHHLLHVTREVTSGIMWANLHLLFWLSLIPFFTGWLGENHNAAWPTALYGGVLLMAALAYTILQRLIVSCHGADSKLAAALGNDLKGKLSLGMYALAILFAPFYPLMSDLLYVIVAVMWIVPDRRTRSAVEV